MSPVIRISDSVFKKLQKLAEPFVDSPSSVIEKLLEEYEKKNNVYNTKILVKEKNDIYNHMPSKDSTIEIKIDNVPDLTSSRIITATINGKPAKSWTRLTALLLEEAFSYFNNSFDELKNHIGFHIVKGKTQRDMSYISKINISFTRQNANETFNNLIKVIKKINADLFLKIKFNSNYPREIGIIKYENHETN